MAKRYGIDLGTTYSTISWYDESREEVKPLPLETEDGETSSLRSVVLYPEGASAIVGEVAWNTRKQEPERVIVGIKRKMGDDYFTDEIDGRSRSPQEVSADILRSLKENAEIEMGEEVTDVVITVPAYFGERQCAATMEAAKMVGLNVLNILSEPHAAAVAYSIEKAVNLTDKHVLVYDLGGGTFDVTLIKPVIPARFTGAGASEVQSLTLNTLCKDGNRELGGLDWDEVLIDLVAEKCMEQFDLDPRLDPRNAAVLHDNCERGKRALSKKQNEMVVADLQGHMIEITREEFEERASGLALQTQMRMEQVLAEAEEKHGITKDQIDVLVCGGATRMPHIKQLIKDVIGHDPLEYKNPALLVACGAAYVAHAIDPQATIPLPQAPEPVASASPSQPAPPPMPKAVRITEDSITDITCHAVGIQVVRQDADGERRPYNAVVLERGTLFGDRRDFVTETLFDNQVEVCIRLFEGDSIDVEDCKHLMDFRIEGLPSGRPRGRPIRTTLWFGLNGVISGKAIDLETNHEIDIHYDRWSSPAASSAPAPTRAPTPAPAATPPMSEDPDPFAPGGDGWDASGSPSADEPASSSESASGFWNDPTPSEPTEAPQQDAAPQEDAPQAGEGPFDPAQPTQADGSDAQPAFDGDSQPEPEPSAAPTPDSPSAESVPADGDPQSSSSDDDPPQEMPRPLKLY